MGRVSRKSEENRTVGGTPYLSNRNRRAKVDKKNAGGPFFLKFFAGKTDEEGTGRPLHCANLRLRGMHSPLTYVNSDFQEDADEYPGKRRGLHPKYLPITR
jgi:hypothetical protein